MVAVRKRQALKGRPPKRVPVNRWRRQNNFMTVKVINSRAVPQAARVMLATTWQGRNIKNIGMMLKHTQHRLLQKVRLYRQDIFRLLWVLGLQGPVTLSRCGLILLLRQRRLRRRDLVTPLHRPWRLGILLPYRGPMDTGKAYSRTRISTIVRATVALCRFYVRRGAERKKSPGWTVTNKLVRLVIVRRFRRTCTTVVFPFACRG